MITEALNLSYTLTHTHTNIQCVVQIHNQHTPQRPRAGLNYRPPDRAYLLKNGGVVSEGQLLLLKIATQKVKPARPDCTDVTQETVETWKKQRGRKKGT